MQIADEHFKTIEDALGCFEYILLRGAAWGEHQAQELNNIRAARKALLSAMALSRGETKEGDK